MVSSAAALLLAGGLRGERHGRHRALTPQCCWGQCPGLAQRLQTCFTGAPFRVWEVNLSGIFSW